MGMGILELNNISQKYFTKSGETLTLQNFNLSVSAEEFVAIVGPSGCGKTTILSLICGLLSPTSGTITMQQSAEDGKSVGYMLQRDQLFEWRTIEKNVLLGLEIQHILTQKNRDYALDMLTKYGLKEFLGYYPTQLSGGMRQRVALIRTLAYRPTILLLDEPFSALDYQTRLKVCDDVSGIIKTEKKTAILVTHDISEAISLADRVVVLSKRPASVKSVYKIEMDGTPLSRRENKKFGEYFDKIWRDLAEETNE